jgi:hypothetical protein
LVCLNRILLPEAERPPTVVTCSFSFFVGDDSSTIGNVSSTGSNAFQMSSLFSQLAAIGVGVFMIAQDRGSDDGFKDGKTHVNYPGSDPWVTCVGGTVIGNIKNGPPVTFDEVVWSNVGSATHVGGPGGATGGGASANFPIPSYQSSAGITSITDSKGNKSTKRFIPDVAGMVSYGGSGFQDWFWINGFSYSLLGTSCACPLFAGLYAVMASALGTPLGFFNPAIYQIGSSVCNDITSGNNDPADGSGAPFYTAAAGWDPCTGWGSIDGTKLLSGLAGLLPPWLHLGNIARHALQADFDCSRLDNAARSVTVADVDNDGSAEVVIQIDAAGSGGNDFWVMKFNPATHAWGHLSQIAGHPLQADFDCSGLGNAARSVTAGDVDGDGPRWSSRSTLPDRAATISG